MVVFAVALLLDVASVVWVLWASSVNGVPIVVPPRCCSLGLILTAVSLVLFVSVRGRLVPGAVGGVPPSRR